MQPVNKENNFLQRNIGITRKLNNDKYSESPTCKRTHIFLFNLFANSIISAGGNSAGELWMFCR